MDKSLKFGPEIGIQVSHFTFADSGIRSREADSESAIIEYLGLVSQKKYIYPNGIKLNRGQRYFKNNITND